MSDGVVSLQRDDGQREDRQLRGEHPEESSRLTAGRKLPGERELAKLAQGRCIHYGQEAWNLRLINRRFEARRVMMKKLFLIDDPRGLAMAWKAYDMTTNFPFSVEEVWRLRISDFY